MVAGTAIASGRSTAMTAITEPMGYCDGSLVPLRVMGVPVFDAGFLHGVVVSEQVRTFGRRPFLLERHYQRWLKGLRFVGIQPPCDYLTLENRIRELVDVNASLLPSTSEQGICFLATPGNQTSFAWPSDDTASHSETRLLVHTYPLNTRLWEQFYRSGVALTTTAIREVPDECWPKSVKIRSRLHYYRAQQLAAATHPGSFPILLNHDGTVADSAIASIVGYRLSEGIIVRETHRRFDSISVEFVAELASRLDIPLTFREFSIDELYQFDEVFLASTPWCILPVATIDQRLILNAVSNKPQSFEIFKRMINAWSEHTGTRIAPAI